MKYYLNTFEIARAIEQLGGLESENDYPYTAHAEKCHFNKTKVHVRITGAVDLPQDETAMAQYLYANGPLSIGEFCNSKSSKMLNYFIIKINN